MFYPQTSQSEDKEKDHFDSLLDKQKDQVFRITTKRLTKTIGGK